MILTQYALLQNKIWATPLLGYIFPFLNVRKCSLTIETSTIYNSDILFFFTEIFNILSLEKEQKITLKSQSK